jgi:hypothetical protein
MFASDVQEVTRQDEIDPTTNGGGMVPPLVVLVLVDEVWRARCDAAAAAAGELPRARLFVLPHLPPTERPADDDDAVPVFACLPAPADAVMVYRLQRRAGRCWGDNRKRWTPLKL